MEAIKKHYVVVFFAVLFLSIFYEVLYRNSKSYLLNHYSLKTKAIIIDERNYFGNSPVSHEYSYSYSFEVIGNIYKGNSHNSSLNIGDTIIVEYVSFYPNLNKALNQKK